MAVKKVSIRDIADKAGVSTSLVSFVLNGKTREHRVGEETARHVMEIAREMNYQPNVAAKSLRSGKTGTIGVIVSDIANPFFSQVLRHIEDEAAKLGYTAVFGSSDEDAEKMKTLVTTMLNRGVDGLIIVPCENAENSVKSLLRSNTPILLLDRPIFNLNISYVSLNNHQASYSSVRHLVSQGYKKISMVAYNVELSHMTERIRGYRDAMADNGLKHNINIGYLKQKQTNKTADKVISKLVQGGAEALLFATNTISIESLRYINEAGIKVPDQLALVGFDGSEAFDFFYSPVTYVKQPVDILAQKAVSTLVDRISNRNISVQSVQVDGQLIERASSAGKPQRKRKNS